MFAQQDVEKCNVSGYLLAYRRQGSGETILLVHGITTYSLFWRRVAPLLSTGYDATGPGILQEEQGRFYDRFFRGSLAESGHIPGTGLGLSIAQETVRAHGGRVTVASEVGQGSAFTTWLSVA